MQNFTFLVDWPFCFNASSLSILHLSYVFLSFFGLQPFRGRTILLLLLHCSAQLGPDLDWALWLPQEDKIMLKICSFSSKIFPNGTTKYYIKKCSPTNASTHSLTYKTHQNYSSDVPVTLIHPSEFPSSHSLNISNVIHQFSDWKSFISYYVTYWLTQRLEMKSEKTKHCMHEQASF